MSDGGCRMADNTALFAALDALPAQVEAAAVRGMRAVAPRVTALAIVNAQKNIIGMSGATFFSTVTRVDAERDDDDATFQAAYDAAAEALRGFTGHAGQPLAEGADPVPAGVVRATLTTPTTYAALLETSDALGKAFLADSMDEGAPVLFQGAVDALREVFGG